MSPKKALQKKLVCLHELIHEYMDYMCNVSDFCPQ